MVSRRDDGLVRTSPQRSTPRDKHSTEPTPEIRADHCSSVHTDVKCSLLLVWAQSTDPQHCDSVAPTLTAEGHCPSQYCLFRREPGLPQERVPVHSNFLPFDLCLYKM